jgi:hypothetical protein
MANSIRLITVSVAAAGLALLAAPGCSDDKEAPANAAGKGGSGGSSGTGSGGSSGAGNGGSSGAGTGGTAGSGGAAGSGGVTDSGGGDAAVASCQSYCDEIGDACKDENQQWADPGACMTGCQAMTKGTSTDTTGDTLGCRFTHTLLARGYDAGSDLRALHCVHAGPSGGGDAGPCH